MPILISFSLLISTPSTSTQTQTALLLKSEGGGATPDVIDERGFENLSRNGKVDFYQHLGCLLEVSHSDNGPKVKIWLNDVKPELFRTH